MAQRSLRPCKQRGCKNCTRDISGYCLEHKGMYEAKGKLQHIEYKRYRQDHKEQQFYNSMLWKKTRKERLTIDNGLCQTCLEDDRLTLADMVHHEIEVKDDWDKRLDIDNLISLCNACHNKVHGK